MSPMVKQPLTVELALLGFPRQQPMHAYEIHQTLMRNEALGVVLQFRIGQVEAILAWLDICAAIVIPAPA